MSDVMNTLINGFGGHQHSFEKVEGRLDNMFVCECGDKLRLDDEPSDKTVEDLKTPGFNLNNLPRGTTAVYIMANGATIALRVPTWEELLANAVKARDYYTELVQQIEQKMEEEKGQASDEWPNLLEP